LNRFQGPAASKPEPLQGRGSTRTQMVCGPLVMAIEVAHSRVRTGSRRPRRKSVAENCLATRLPRFETSKRAERFVLSSLQLKLWPATLFACQNMSLPPSFSRSKFGISRSVGIVGACPCRLCCRDGGLVHCESDVVPPAVFAQYESEFQSRKNRLPKLVVRQITNGTTSCNALWRTPSHFNSLPSQNVSYSGRNY
jgi:hypothetical protein